MLHFNAFLSLRIIINDKSFPDLGDFKTCNAIIFFLFYLIQKPCFLYHDWEERDSKSLSFSKVVSRFHHSLEELLFKIKGEITGFLFQIKFLLAVQ